MLPMAELLYNSVHFADHVASERRESFILTGRQGLVDESNLAFLAF